MIFLCDSSPEFEQGGKLAAVKADYEEFPSGPYMLLVPLFKRPRIGQKSWLPGWKISECVNWDTSQNTTEWWEITTCFMCKFAHKRSTNATPTLFKLLGTPETEDEIFRDVERCAGDPKDRTEFLTKEHQWKWLETWSDEHESKTNKSAPLDENMAYGDFYESA